MEERGSGLDTGRADQLKRENDRRKWLIIAAALLSLLAFLLVALLMVGIPYLNANLVQGTGMTSKDLASWQVTSLIAMVGMLITGVFVITAFRVDSTAEHTASNEARKVMDREVRGVAHKLDVVITDGQRNLDGVVKQGRSDMERVVKEMEREVERGRSEMADEVRHGKSAMGKVVEEGESNIKKTVDQGNAAVERAVHEAESRTTEAIRSEGERFQQATRAALSESDREFRQLIEQIQSDNQAVRAFLDERAPGVVRESFTAEQLEAIAERAAAGLTEEWLAEQVRRAVQDIVEKEPERLVDPVVEQVAAMRPRRSLFGRGGRTPGA